MRKRIFIAVPPLVAGIAFAAWAVAGSSSRQVATISNVRLVDSQTTCTNPNSCKTVGVDSSGKLTSGSTSGTITFIGTLQANTTYSLPDVIEALGGSHMFVGGSYTLAFAATCANGSATSSSTYTAVGGPSTYPQTPPSTSGTLATITTDSAGSFSCAYTLTYPTIDSSNDSTCGQHLCSVRNDVWVVNSGGTAVTQTGSFSVDPDGQPPTGVPETPWAILIPIAIVLVSGLAILAWRRKLVGAI